MKSVVTVAVLLLTHISLAPAQVITIEKHEGTYDFKVDNSLVTTYHFEATVAKPYFWPVNAPGNIPVTRSWPLAQGAPKETTDHVHQKSAWFCHGDIRG